MNQIPVYIPLKSQCLTTSQLLVPSKGGISPAKNSSPGKINQRYEQQNIAVLGIRTRLAELEDDIYSQISRIETCLQNLSGASTISSSGSSADHLWSGLDADFLVSETNNTCYFFNDPHKWKAHATIHYP